MKDGDRLVQKLRDKAKERDKRYMEYLFKCPIYGNSIEYYPMERHTVDGSEITFNQN